MVTQTAEQPVKSAGEVLAAHIADRASLIPILQEVQDKFGYLPSETMLEVADYVGVRPSTVYGVASFYNQFRFKPLGRNHIKVCMGTACHMNGGPLVLEALERELGIGVGEVTEDGEYSLDRVACVGCCVLAPVVVVGDDFHPRLSSFKVEEMLVGIKERSEHRQTEGDKTEGAHD